MLYSQAVQSSGLPPIPMLVTKASVPPVTAAADRAVSGVAVAFLAAVAVVRKSTPLQALAGAVEGRSYAAIMELLRPEERLASALRGVGLRASETSFLESLQRVFQAGARAELDELASVPVAKAIVPTIGSMIATIGSMIAFDLLNMEALNFIQNYLPVLIREVSNATREAVQEVVVEAFREGGHPYEQARTIRNIVGLTRRQARAVQNFRKMLESGDSTQMQEALTRALRDGRFDASIRRAIQNQARLPQAQIDKMVQRYFERALKYRAESIARTETIRASVAGQEELWRQAVRQGLMDPEKTRKKWSVSYDERLCPKCRSIPRLNPQGVRLDAAFQSSEGPVMRPPDPHTHCRCGEILVFLR